MCVCSDGVYDFGQASQDKTRSQKYLAKGTTEVLLQFALRLDFRTLWELTHAAMVLGTPTLTKTFENELSTIHSVIL